jgi:hypothetical protein
VEIHPMRCAGRPRCGWAPAEHGTSVATIPARNARLSSVMR